MKIYFLSDNKSTPDLSGEWGLSILIEYQDQKVLLDAGASPLFLENAALMGLDIGGVDYAVLSHAHFDHADGFPYFFGANSKASLYMQECAQENCYDFSTGQMRYVGIPRGMLQQYHDRIKKVSGIYPLFPDVYLIPHAPQPNGFIPSHSHYIYTGSEYQNDLFSHEQSLVFDTQDGLVIFSCCSHIGLVKIINEIRDIFPDRRIQAFIGGLHLFDRTQSEIDKLAEEMKAIGIDKIYTGHCTGDAFIRLKEILGDRMEQFFAGMVIDL